MRLGLATLLLSALGLCSSASADSLPSCPPGQRMDCHPTERSHGCGGCVPIEAEEPAPSPDPATRANEDTAENTAGSAADDEGAGGGCQVAWSTSAGVAWALAPFGLVWMARRRRGARRPQSASAIE